MWQMNQPASYLAIGIGQLCQVKDGNDPPFARVSHTSQSLDGVVKEFTGNVRCSW